MTTAPQAFGSGAVMPAETIHVTGRRVLATIIDGLIFATDGGGHLFLGHDAEVGKEVGGFFASVRANQTSGME